MTARWLLTVAVVLATFVPPLAPAHFVSSCQGTRCKRHVVRPFNARLERMAGCESTWRWHITGAFDGGLQFSASTWSRTGSRYARAHYAPELEQKYRAVVWARMIGWAWHSTAGWPVCG